MPRPYTTVSPVSRNGVDALLPDVDAVDHGEHFYDAAFFHGRYPHSSTMKVTLVSV